LDTRERFGPTTMSFTIAPLSTGCYKLILDDEPEYVHPLQVIRDSVQGQLDGWWLVVAFAVWHSRDYQAVRAAIDCAKEFDGRFQLAIQPFDNMEELKPWWPTDDVLQDTHLSVRFQESPAGSEMYMSDESLSHPLWLVLKDGSVMHGSAGPRTKKELVELMRAFLG
jgi:hypothetical protein